MSLFFIYHLNLVFLTGTKIMTFHGDLHYPSSTLIEKLDSLDEKDEVGSGGFGTVYKVVLNTEHDIFYQLHGCFTFLLEILFYFNFN